MTTYNCVPSAQTVSPCPAGTAPDVVVVESSDAADRYPGNFDHIPVQDVLVGIALVFALLLGIVSGRR